MPPPESHAPKWHNSSAQANGLGSVREGGRPEGPKVNPSGVRHAPRLNPTPIAGHNCPRSRERYWAIFPSSFQDYPLRFWTQAVGGVGLGY